MTISRQNAAQDRGLSSLWGSTAPAGPDAPPLTGEQTADVVVIGAGLTGLSAALSLQRAGVDVIVLEGHEPGWGASGRNNGQVIPVLSKRDPDEVIARFGEAGERFVAMLRGSADMLFDMIRDYGIDAEAERTGWLNPAHSPGRLRAAERRVRQWQRHGADARLLSRDEMAALTGSDAWHGGMHLPAAGHVNPLALVRGMASAFVARGGRLHNHSPATEFRHAGGGWQVTTPGGRLRAAGLVLAGNAYGEQVARDLVPGLARQIIPVTSWQMATAPLPPEVLATILPGRHAMSDSHRELRFGRPDRRGRLVTGGALVGTWNGAERLRKVISTRLQEIWPQIGTPGFDFVWNGKVGMTPDFFPRFHRIGPNGYGWIGCNGRGVALAVAVGAELARAASGVAETELALPLVPVRPLPLRNIAARFAPLMLLRYRQQDAREVPAPK